MSMQVLEPPRHRTGAIAPRYYGCTERPSGEQGYTFVLCRTIRHIDGPELPLPRRDLYIHRDNNPRLGRTIPGGTWITFCLRPGTRTQSRLEVYDADVEYRPRRTPKQQLTRAH